MDKGSRGERGGGEEKQTSWTSFIICYASCVRFTMCNGALRIGGEGGLFFRLSRRREGKSFDIIAASDYTRTRQVKNAWRDSGNKAGKVQ